MSLAPDSIRGLAGFRSALRQFLAASETISRQAGVTPQQYQAMLAIRAWDVSPMTVKDLAAELLLTHHAAVQLLDRLTAADLARREASADDRRKMIVTLTEQGKAQVERLAEQHVVEILRHEPQLGASLARVRNAYRRKDGA